MIKITKNAINTALLKLKIDLKKEFTISIPPEHLCEEFHLSTNLLLILTESIAKNRDLDLGLLIFPQIIEIATKLEEISDRCNTLSKVMKSALALENIEFKKSIILMLLEVSNGVKESEYRSNLLQILC